MAIDYKLIDRLEKEKRQLIAEQPHLKMLQTEIDIVMNEAGDDPLLRCKAVAGLMCEIVERELAPAMLNLNRDLNQVTKKRYRTD